MAEIYVLKHKNYDVAVMRIDEETGELTDLEVMSPKDMPVLGRPDFRSTARWFASRAIPNGRERLEKILQEAGCRTSEAYLVKNLALGLSDTYWICPANMPLLTWEQVNLYSHAGQTLVFHDGEGRAYYTSTDASLTGSLDKKAVYKDGAWFLQKNDAGKSGEGLQNINEAFASLVHKQQGFLEYVPYSLNFNAFGVPETCECRYFTDTEHELVSAIDAAGGSTGRYDGKQALEEFIDVCEDHGLERNYVQNFLDYQALTDFLITNTDRHWNNFGILRDPESLRFLSMAPIYDSGTSMLFNDPFVKNRLSLLKIETNGVERLQEDRLRLIKNPNLVNVQNLPSEAEAEKFYTDCNVIPERAAQIAHCYALKADMVCELQHHITVSIAHEIEYLGTPAYAGLSPNPEYRENGK